VLYYILGVWEGRGEKEGILSKVGGRLEVACQRTCLAGYWLCYVGSEQGSVRAALGPKAAFATRIS